MKFLFLDKCYLLNYKNIQINTISPCVEDVHHNMDGFAYGSIIQDPQDNNFYIYICTGPYYNQVTKKYLIKDDKFIYKQTYDLKAASHNSFVFVDNMKVNLIGGQSMLDPPHVHECKACNYETYPNMYLSTKEIKTINFSYIVNPYIPCLWYGNGLYLFEKDKLEDKFNSINDLPIVNGVHKGRMEGYYSNFRPIQKNIGISVYDCISSFFL